MEWKEKIIDLGEMLVKERKSFIFTSLVNLDNVKSVTTSCSCTSASVKGNKIIGNFRSGNFPMHLLGKNSYETNKLINITYKDGFKDTLIVKAKILR